LALACGPLWTSAAAAGDTVVQVTQDSCVATNAGPVAYFSVANSGTAVPVCQVTVFPLDAPCFPLECGAPAGWTCFPGDVTTFWQAAENGACISAGTSRGGFFVRLFDAACCFGVNALAADGTFLGGQELCFQCGPVGVESRTWTHIKTLYE